MLGKIFTSLSLPRKVFWVIFGLGLLSGLLIGLLNLVAPGASDVSLNGENIEGMMALLAAVLISGIPAFIFGIIAAGIISLFTRNKKSN